MALNKGKLINNELSSYLLNNSISHSIEELILFDKLDEDGNWTLMIKAHMGTGKTTKLFEKLNTMSPCVWVMVSFRITLTIEMMNKMKNYDNINCISYRDGCDKFVSLLDTTKVNVCVVLFESLHNAWKLLGESPL